MLRLVIYDASDQPQEMDAVVDAGFNGRLTLPPDSISRFGLAWLRAARALLADGSEIITQVYEAKVLWNGNPVIISVSEANAEPLVGMSLMYGYELVLPVLDGATFTLRPLPTPWL